MNRQKSSENPSNLHPGVIEKKSLVKQLLKRKPNRKCKNENQKEFVRKIEENQIVFCVGSAGTGKSHIALMTALGLIMDVNAPQFKISILRAPVESGETNMGFLPGNLLEKLYPFMEPAYELIAKLYDEQTKNKMIDEKILHPRSVGHIRGHNFDNEIVIVDEAQNLTESEIKLILTRIGHDSKMIFIGDTAQKDVRVGKISGLEVCYEKLSDIEGIDRHEFTDADIVRNPIIGKILKKLS